MMTKFMAAKFWRDPFFVMSVVAFMYGLKVFGKITVGELINSPMISGDGFHNIADLFEALAVMLVVFLVRKAPSKRYPFGLKQMEYLSSLVIGVTLFLVAINFAMESVVGLLAQLPALDMTVREALPYLPTYRPLIMSSEALPWILTVVGGSAMMSLLVSRYQISVGTEAGHQSMIADGQETWSDGRIELVVFAGVLCEYILHAAWLEYPLGLYVAYLVAKTACGLIKTGWCALLLKTIGPEHEDRVTDICMDTAGVLGVRRLSSFRVGHAAVIMMTLESRAAHCKTEHIKYAIERAVNAYLEEEGFKGSELQVKFASPSPNRHRIAFAVEKSQDDYIISDHLSDATHLIICDIEDDRIVRKKLIVKNEAPLVVLKSKRVKRLYLFNPGPEDAWLSNSLEVVESPSYVLSMMGV